jgi:tetratricopeptide (TPR) repeat protein
MRRLSFKKKYTTKELWRRGDKLIKKGQKEEAEKILLSAALSSSPLDRHYAYLRLIRLYRSILKEQPGKIDSLVEICLKDIELFPEFCEAWLLEYMNNVPTPYFPSFSVLAEIYETRGKIGESIALCELALGYGLTETLGEDYHTRLERLFDKQNKLSEHKQT